MSKMYLRAVVLGLATGLAVSFLLLYLNVGSGSHPSGKVHHVEVVGRIVGAVRSGADVEKNKGLFGNNESILNGTEPVSIEQVFVSCSQRNTVIELNTEESVDLELLVVVSELTDASVFVNRCRLSKQRLVNLGSTGCGSKEGEGSGGELHGDWYYSRV